jgi:hypothetical protein
MLPLEKRSNQASGATRALSVFRSPPTENKKVTNLIQFDGTWRSWIGFHINYRDYGSEDES